MSDFEKLGVFYLGKRYDPGAGILGDELLLYDSKDLTTHAVIIGMTGSGKTGLGIGLIEEAVIDNIPVLAIDPKGDLGNLLLAFPEMRPEDLKPWVNAQDAAAAGISVDEYAQEQAALWRKGLAEWGQDCARIGRLKRERNLPFIHREVRPAFRCACFVLSKLPPPNSGKIGIFSASGSKPRQPAFWDYWVLRLIPSPAGSIFCSQTY